MADASQLETWCHPGSSGVPRLLDSDAVEG